MSEFNMKDFWEQNMAFQQSMAKNWMDAAQRFMGPSGAEAAAAENPLFTNMNKVYQQMYSNWQEQFLNNPLMKNYPWTYNMFNTQNTPFDITNKMMNGGKTFNDLATFWQKLTQTDPFASRQSIMDFINQNKTTFEKLTEDFLQPFIPDTMRPLVAQARELMSQFESVGGDFSKPWTEMMGSLRGEEFYKKLFSGGQGYIDLYKAMNGAYGESFGKLFSAAGFGLTKEQNEELMSQFDSFFRMMLSLTELMTLVSDVSKGNMATVIESWQELAKTGAEPKSMKEFYDMWIKINEESFIKVFATPEFSRVFGEFSKRACELKIHTDKVLEHALDWAPFPKKSQMDGLYKTVYDLRKSDYANTQRLSAIEQELASIRELIEKKSK